MATGKLGYARDRLLLYGKGGGAWVGSSSPGLTVNNVLVVPGTRVVFVTLTVFWVSGSQSNMASAPITKKLQNS
jgi:hypothetical protein